MTVTIRQLHPVFFGEVSGVDLRKPLTPQEAADIEAGMDKYAVLLFRNQDITDEQQLAFALNFGDRENARGAVMASDAFFPFADGVEAAARAGVTAVIQPGGSVRDDEVIAAANERGIVMVLTGVRHFRH